jgi:hypothetical protein
MKVTACDENGREIKHIMLLISPSLFANDVIYIQMKSA